MTNVVKFDNPELLSLEKSKAEQIKSTFEPMAKMLSEFEGKYNDVLLESEKGITKVVTEKAKRLRINIGRVRIETGKLKDKQKEYIKLEDRAIMGVHNILVWAVKEKEDKLKKIENHFEIMEKQRLDALQLKRVELISPYIEDAHERDLSKFADDEFDALLAMKKKAYEDMIAAEKKAEQDRIAKEKEEAAERERIRQENERLRKEAEEHERLAKIEAEKRAIRYKELQPYIIFIRDYDNLISLPEKEYKKQFSEIKIGAEQHWEFERKEQIRKQKEEDERVEKERKERDAYEAKLKAEREEKERVMAEMKAKEDAERKAREDEQARLQAELNKGDADKVNDLKRDLESLKTKYSFKSVKNKKMYADVGVLIDKVINYINN